MTGLRGSGGLGGLAGLGLPDFGNAAGPFGVDPAMMQQMLQNPAIMQMMQGLLSNPQYINQVHMLCCCCSTDLGDKMQRKCEH